MRNLPRLPSGLSRLVERQRVEHYGKSRLYCVLLRFARNPPKIERQGYLGKGSGYVINVLEVQ